MLHPAQCPATSVGIPDPLLVAQFWPEAVGGSQLLWGSELASQTVGQGAG